MEAHQASRGSLLSDQHRRVFEGKDCGRLLCNKGEGLLFNCKLVFSFCERHTVGDLKADCFRSGNSKHTITA